MNSACKSKREGADGRAKVKNEKENCLCSVFHFEKRYGILYSKCENKKTL